MTTEENSTQLGAYVHANGIDIYYEEYGSGYPLLLIHGGIVNHTMWEKHIPAFAQHFQVIAPDSRGHGRTNNPTGTMSWRLLGDDMAALIQALDLDRPFVCGYSDGGQITMEIALHYPGLARAYVAGGTSYRMPEVALRWLEQVGFEQPGIVNFEQFERSEPGFVELMRKHQEPFQGHDSWKSYLTQLSRMWLDPLYYTTEEMKQITEPLLLLAGDRDDFAAPLDDIVYMYRTIPKAELAIVPAAGHFLKVELFDTLVLDFLLRHSSPDMLEKAK